jgi:ribosome-associated heat shock protein Hsp15
MRSKPAADEILTSDTQRIDLWLMHARFFKTRALSTKSITKGRVRILTNGSVRRLSKASAHVRLGDILTLSHNDPSIRIKVLGMSDRRGSAPEAQTLYEAYED